MTMELTNLMRFSMLAFVILVIVLLEDNYATATTNGQAPTPDAQPPCNQPKRRHGVTQGSLRLEECEPHCKARCSKTAYKKPCLFFCNKCCSKCLCVPPGTYGNKQTCPCYNNWMTKRGGPKCP